MDQMVVKTIALKCHENKKAFYGTEARAKITMMVANATDAN